MAEKRTAKNKLLQLIEAVSTEDVKNVDSLLAAGADANAADDRGLTLLMHAARSTDTPRIVKRLLDAGADPAATDDHGWSALRYAQRREPSKAQQAIVEMLGGAEKSEEKRQKPHGKPEDEVEGPERGFLPRLGARLMSINSRTLGVLLVLLSLGVYLLTAGILVAFGVAGYHNVLRAASPAYGISLFLCMLLLGCALGLRSKRLKSHLKSQMKDEEGESEPDRTPLMAALEEGADPEKLRSLIKAGADVNERNVSLGQTVLMWAAVGCTDPALFRVLLEAGAHVDDVDNEGTTALMLAAIANENPAVIKVLIGAGADVNAVDEGGDTVLGMALGRAEQKGHGEIIRMLKDAGAVQHLKRRKGHPR
jgi:uncharacterized protein